MNQKTEHMSCRGYTKPCIAARQHRVGSGAIVPGYCGFGYEFSIYHLSIIHTGLLGVHVQWKLSGFLPHLPVDLWKLVTFAHVLYLHADL